MQEEEVYPTWDEGQLPAMEAGEDEDIGCEFDAEFEAGADSFMDPDEAPVQTAQQAWWPQHALNRKYLWVGREVTSNVRGRPHNWSNTGQLKSVNHKNVKLRDHVAFDSRVHPCALGPWGDVHTMIFGPYGGHSSSGGSAAFGIACGLYVDATLGGDPEDYLFGIDIVRRGAAPIIEVPVQRKHIESGGVTYDDGFGTQRRMALANRKWQTLRIVKKVPRDAINGLETRLRPYRPKHGHYKLELAYMGLWRIADFRVTK